MTLHLRSALRVTASLRYKIAPKSPFLCVNRGPIRYRFRPGANATSGIVRVNKASVQSIETKIVTDLELKKKRVEIITSGNIYYYALYSLFVFSLAKSSINESFASL